MERLCELLQPSGPASHGRTMELAELYRALGRFDEARVVLQAMDPKDFGTPGRLIAQMVEEKERAPMQYEE